MNKQQYPFAPPATTVSALVDGAQRERDRRGRHEQYRNNHAKRHVRQHVLAEQEFLVDVNAAVSDVKQQSHAENP